MLASARSLSLVEQSNNFTGEFMQSVFGIVWLNETLPHYMARNYTLTPFKAPFGPLEESLSEVWNATITLYSVEMSCEEGRRQIINESEYYNSSNGWRWPTNLGVTGHKTMRGKGLDKIKEYSMLYVGYWNDLGLAGCYQSGDYYPVEAIHTFYAAFTRNKKQEADPPGNLTSILCEPKYYSQLVSATVALPLMHPVDVIALGPKVPISLTTFNTTILES
jgi:hypothetical protein